MERRPLGKTGLMVPKLGFGCSPLGRVFGDVPVEECIRAVHRAIDLGVNLFDVSPLYGLTRAESVLGQALRSVPRDRFFLSTKTGRYGPEDFDFTAGRVVSSLEESMSRLNVDYVDLFLCHDIEFVKLDQIVEETLPAIYDLRDQGKVRFVGVSGFPLQIYRWVLERARLDFILSYCHYTLQDNTLLELIPFLREKGVGIINAAPLSMGLLTQQGTPDWHPASQEIRQACTTAAEYCRAKGADLAELALSFSLDGQGVDTTLTGIANTAELERNLAAIEKPIDGKLLSEVQSILAPVHNITWPSGLPENN